MFPSAKFQYYSVSGIILDAINHSTPIISLRSEVLEVFSKGIGINILGRRSD